MQLHVTAPGPRTAVRDGPTVIISKEKPRKRPGTRWIVVLRYGGGSRRFRAPYSNTAQTASTWMQPVCGSVSIRALLLDFPGAHSLRQPTAPTPQLIWHTHELTYTITLCRPSMHKVSRGRRPLTETAPDISSHSNKGSRGRSFRLACAFLEPR